VETLIKPSKTLSDLRFPDQPSYVADVVVTSVGTHLGCAVEYATGMSHVEVIVPIVVILAPGAGALQPVIASVNDGLAGSTSPAATI